MANNPLNFGFLLFQGLTLLDLAGPAEVFGCMRDVALSFISKDMGRIVCENGFIVLPTHSFASCPDLDLICVPGGPGQIAVMDDFEILRFISVTGSKVPWVASVCTGSLILGAAGLLTGYKATCHVSALAELNAFGAMPSAQRVVHDRNRITGAGVAAGIDLGLYVATLLQGENVAEIIRSELEYGNERPRTVSTIGDASVSASAPDERQKATLRAADRLRHSIKQHER